MNFSIKFIPKQIDVCSVFFRNKKPFFLVWNLTFGPLFGLFFEKTEKNAIKPVLDKTRLNSLIMLFLGDVNHTHTHTHTHKQTNKQPAFFQFIFFFWLLTIDFLPFVLHMVVRSKKNRIKGVTEKILFTNSKYSTRTISCVGDK